MGAFELLNPKLEKMAKDRFGKPTNIQEMAIPEIMKGSNVIVIAGTGFGKTESVVLPILSKLSEDPHRTIAALYITPLRSLNRDMFDRLFWWADKLDLEVALRHGDTAQKERAEHRESPPNMMVTTPESLQAMLAGKIMKKHLASVRYVIIDEIHELISSERGVQLSLALERLRRLCGGFQTVGISATVGTPEIVAEFAGGAKLVRSEVVKDMDVKIILPLPKPEDSKLEEKLFLDKNSIARLREIIEMIKAHKSTLLFTNTRQTAEVLSSRLRVLEKNLLQDVHHGSLSKEARIKTEKQFKGQELKALIATSSLELGIDIGSIDFVIQYLSPRQVTKMIQRIGRGGHSVGEKSSGIMLTDSEDVFEAAVINKHLKEKKLEKTLIHHEAMDVLSHQIIGMAMDEYGIKSDDIFNTVKKSYCYRNLERKRFDELLNFLMSLGMVFIDPKTGEVRRGRKAFQYYFDNLSTIADTLQYKIVDMVTNEPIGSLDEAFVAEHCQTGNTFICKGRGWKVVQVEKNKVMVEPFDKIESAIPSWEGELIPVPFDIAQDVGRLRRKMAEKKVDDALLRKEYGLDSNSIDEMKSIMEKQKKFFMPDEKSMIIETHQDFLIIHSCFGSKANNTIGRYIGSMLNARHGVSLQMKANPYSIIFKTIAKPQEILEIIQNASDIEKMVIDSLENSQLFKWRFVQVAKRFGIIERGAYFDKINIGKLISFYRNSPVYDETLREICLEKLDLENSKKILEKIGKEEISSSVSKGLSPIGEQNLIYQFGELLAPKEPTSELFKFFRKRLLNTQVTMICMNCGKFHLTQRVNDIESDPECPKCSSRLMGVISSKAENLLNIIKKKLSGKKLTQLEEKEYDRARRTADLTIVYGKKAIFVLAAHGVGAETASRILAKLQASDDQLLRDIFEAEKTFAKTKKYWK
jgi:ATP-dependent Lhr-like helicase